MSAISNNKRIAKNTILLYFRMLIIMLVNLFTVRIVLNTLGVVDYGIYNVVGGVVVMFSFISRSMSTASQRFFSFELGKQNIDKLQKIFSATMFFYIILIVVILLFAETLGWWFLNNKLNIPDERMVAANWIFQFALLSFVVTMITVPYDSLIVAHERMNVYAYISIIEAILKLLIVYLLVIIPFDKLKTYAILVFLSSYLSTLLYRIYCRKHFPESRLIFHWDKTILKDIVSYSGWNLFDTLSGTINHEGSNFLLNIFFGPVVNTARGISYQVNAMLNMFVVNFTTATRPQIIKHFSINEKNKMYNLVFISSKLSYFLLFIIALPILIEADTLFELWLKQVPDFLTIFSRLVIIATLIDVISYPIITTAQATGNIKRFFLTSGCIKILTIFVSYVLLKKGFAPPVVYYMNIISYTLCLIFRLKIVQRIAEFPVKRFVVEVLFRIVIVTALSFSFVYYIFINFEQGYLRAIVVFLMSVLVNFIFIYLIGLNKEEKMFVKKTIKTKLSTKTKNQIDYQ